MTHKRVQWQGPVLTLGNQDLWANYDQLKSFFRQMDCAYSEATIVPHTSALFNTHPRLKEKAKNFVHAKTFFEMLGIREYWDLDKFDRDQPRILHDLNLPVAPDLHNKFNLIIDGGTTEHVFDVRQVMENLIRMCRLSGWIVHISPASNFLDHGFYSFSPVLFYDLYGTNGFDDFICYLWQVHPDPLRYFDASSYFEYRYGMNYASLLDPHKQTVVFFAARKSVDAQTIAIPTQGAYDPVPREWAATSPRRSVFDGALKPLRPLWTRIQPHAILWWARLSRWRQVLFPRYRRLKKI